MDRRQVIKAFERLAVSLEWRVLNREEMNLLLAKVCGQFDGGSPPNQKALNLAVMAEYHAIADVLCPTERVAKALLGGDSFDDDPEWIPFEKVLAILTPLLLEIHFIDRCLGAMRTLAWPYPSIAKQYNAVLPSLASTALASEELGALLGKFHEFRELMRRALSTDTQAHCAWFRNLLNGKDTWRLDHAALAVMAKCLERAPDVRFEGRGEQFALLRDRWSDVKQFLAGRVKACQFIRSTT